MRQIAVLIHLVKVITLYMQKRASIWQLPITVLLHPLRLNAHISHEQHIFGPGDFVMYGIIIITLTTEYALDGSRFHDSQSSSMSS